MIQVMKMGEYERAVRRSYSDMLRSQRPLDHDFEGCDHIVEELYDFAREYGISILRVHDEMNLAWYESMQMYDGKTDEEMRLIDTRLLEGRVLDSLRRLIKIAKRDV